MNMRYSTKPGKPGWSVRHVPGWPTIKYHLGVSLIIREVARNAARGRFGTAEFAKCSRDILSVAEACGGSVEVDGLQYVKDGMPAVFVANHMGSIETLVVACLILPFGEATFVLKESLMHYPVFRHLVRGIDPITVGRINARDDLKTVLNGGAERLKEGVSVVIFPQATRSPVFDMAKFNSMGVKLAAKAGVPIIPLAVKTDFLASGRIHKDFGRVYPSRPIKFRFGPPIKVSDHPKEGHRQSMEFIVGCLEEWGLPVIRSDG